MGKLYDTDMSDAAWALVSPELPPAKPRGRPRSTRLHAVLDAVFCFRRTGCRWRRLPRACPIKHGQDHSGHLGWVACIGPPVAAGTLAVEGQEAAPLRPASLQGVPDLLAGAIHGLLGEP